MEQNNKIRLLVWLVMALVVLNIATIATVVWRARQFRHDRTFFYEMPLNKNLPELSGHLLKEKLKFSKTQFDEFHKIGSDFRSTGKEIAVQMTDIRNNMLKELNSEKPDTAKLFAYARKIGDMHYALKRQMVLYFLNLKGICTPEQSDSLQKIFKFIIPPDGPDQDLGGRKGPLHHPRHQGNER
jgi:Spy/CpxP family protein refolding chaperone